MNIDYINFNQRADRSRYIAPKFSLFLTGKILGVGCEKAVLRSIVKNVDYTDIDIGGTPAVLVVYEKIQHA